MSIGQEPDQLKIQADLFIGEIIATKVKSMPPKLFTHFLKIAMKPWLLANDDNSLSL